MCAESRFAQSLVNRQASDPADIPASYSMTHYTASIRAMIIVRALGRARRLSAGPPGAAIARGRFVRPDLPLLVNPVRDLQAQPRYVFFDFAGTLVEGIPCWEYPQIVACREAGREVTPAQVKAAIWAVWGPREGCAHPEASVSEDTYQQWIGAIEREILRALDVPPDQLDRAAQRVMELQLDPRCYRVYPDVWPTVAALRQQGYRLGIISNFAWRLADLVTNLGLAEAFELIVTSAQAGFRKPRPEIFHHALSRVGIAPAAALYIGDDPICDQIGASNVGLPGWLLDRDRRAAPQQGRIRTLTALIHHLGTRPGPHLQASSDLRSTASRSPSTRRAPVKRTRAGG